MTFSEWLQSRDIDIQTTEPEISAMLQAQYDDQLPAASDEMAEVLVLPADCSWPARGYWTPAAVPTFTHKG